jgi:hypothetical protein
LDLFSKTKSSEIWHFVPVAMAHGMISPLIFAVPAEEGHTGTQDNGIESCEVM